MIFEKTVQEWFCDSLIINTLNMSEEKFPASFLIHNIVKIASVHWSKHELFEKLQILLFSFLGVSSITFVYSRYVDTRLLTADCSNWLLLFDYLFIHSFIFKHVGPSLFKKLWKFYCISFT